MSDEKLIKELKKLATLIRYYILTMSTEAGSGHPSSSLSATELMTCLLFGGIFRFDVDHPKSPNNDRLMTEKAEERKTSGTPRVRGNIPKRHHQQNKRIDMKFHPGLSRLPRRESKMKDLEDLIKASLYLSER